MKSIFIVLIFTGIIVMGILFPVVWWIIGIGLIAVFVLFYLIISGFDKNEDSYMKYKFGENYRDLMAKGLLGLRTACQCKPDSRYTSKERIEELANIKIPDFTIKESKETLADFTGDYSGVTEIDFCKTIDENIIIQIENDMKQEHSRWRKRENDDYVCDLLKPYVSDPPTDEYWTLAIYKNKSKGVIRYGRV